MGCSIETTGSLSISEETMNNIEQDSPGASTPVPPLTLRLLFLLHFHGHSQLN